LENDLFYQFQIFTKDGGTYCSSKKILKSSDCLTSSNEAVIFGNSGYGVIAYPNPLSQGGMLTIEGVKAGSSIFIYNESGAVVKSAVAGDGRVVFNLAVPAGVYIVRSGDGAFKIVVMD